MRSWFTLSLVVLFMACQTEFPPVEENSAPKINYYAMGQEITSIAQAELMKSVKQAMEEGGPVHAIKFCNVHATPLSDSLSKKFDCSINRISIKNRNPLNEPKGKDEIMLMNKMLENSLEKSAVRDTLVAVNGELLYYRPIVIGLETCLKCHGQVGSDISVATMNALNEFYPEDRATNYRLGEFRGAWKISFPMTPEK